MRIKVIFRRYPNGEILALFPEIPGDMDHYTCMSYMFNGQHGVATINQDNITRPAKPGEYQKLKSHLEQDIGYELQVVHRISQKMNAKKIKELEL